MTNRHKIGLALIACLAIARFVFVPWLTWVDTKVERVQALNQNKVRFQGIQDKNEQLSGQEESIASGYQQLSQRWYQGDAAKSSVSILQHIEALAKKQQVELNTRRTGQVAQDQGVSTIPVSLFVKGKPQYIYNFIAAVETQQPISVIQGLRLTKANRSSDIMTALIDMSIVLKAEGASQ